MWFHKVIINVNPHFFTRLDCQLGEKYLKLTLNWEGKTLSQSTLFTQRNFTILCNTIASIDSQIKIEEKINQLPILFDEVIRALQFLSILFFFLFWHLEITRSFLCSLSSELGDYCGLYNLANNQGSCHRDIWTHDRLVESQGLYHSACPLGILHFQIVI